MKLPKKPKAAKMPKKPKRSASVTTWENYDKRCKEVEKRNREKLTDWHKKVAHIKSAKSRKEALIKKHSR